MEDSVFTKIVKGEIPCHKIYEDERTLAFLDIHPLLPGHALVIPKHQVEFIWDLSDEDYAAVMATAKLVARRQREVLPQAYVSARIIGVDVPHAHVQLIPFDDAGALAGHQDMGSEPDHAALSAMAETLAF